MDRMNRTAGCADAPKRDNAASRLDSAISVAKAHSEEIASITGKIREILLGSPPPAIAKDKGLVERPTSGFLGSITSLQEETNRVLTFVLDELRTVLGEIS